jgi:hypothetical protein
MIPWLGDARGAEAERKVHRRPACVHGVRAGNLRGALRARSGFQGLILAFSANLGTPGGDAYDTFATRRARLGVLVSSYDHAVCRTSRRFKPSGNISCRRCPTLGASSFGWYFALPRPIPIASISNTPLLHQSPSLRDHCIVCQSATSFDRYINHEGIRIMPKKQKMAPQRRRSVLVIGLSRVQFPSASRIIPLTDIKKPGTNSQSGKSLPVTSLTTA